MGDSAHPGHRVQPMPGIDRTSQGMPACIHTWGKRLHLDKVNVELTQ
nr:MAG TPA: hypothetical protein [Siphoviridae sp. ctS248]